MQPAQLSGHLEPFGHTAAYIHMPDGTYQIEVLTDVITLSDAPFADVRILTRFSPPLDPPPAAKTWCPTWRGIPLTLPIEFRDRRDSRVHVAALHTRFVLTDSAEEPSGPTNAGTGVRIVPFNLNLGFVSVIGYVCSGSSPALSLIVGQVSGIIAASVIAKGNEPLLMSWTVPPFGAVTLTIRFDLSSIRLSDGSKQEEFSWGVERSTLDE